MGHPASPGRLKNPSSPAGCHAHAAFRVGMFGGRHAHAYGSVGMAPINSRDTEHHESKNPGDLRHRGFRLTGGLKTHRRPPRRLYSTRRTRGHCPGQGSNLHGVLTPPAPQAGASASSATRANYTVRLQATGDSVKREREMTGQLKSRLFEGGDRRLPWSAAAATPLCLVPVAQGRAKAGSRPPHSKSPAAGENDSTDQLQGNRKVVSGGTGSLSASGNPREPTLAASCQCHPTQRGLDFAIALGPTTFPLPRLPACCYHDGMSSANTTRLIGSLPAVLASRRTRCAPGAWPWQG